MAKNTTTSKGPKLTELPTGNNGYPSDANGYPVEGAKTSGIKIRGTGAATKGTMARGPMR